MAIRITTWRPDTCGCEIQYSWDDAVPQEEREHSLHQVTRACGMHAHLDHPEVYEYVGDENTTKNISLGIILDNFEDHTVEVIDNDGVASREFRKSSTPICEVNADELITHTVEITVPTMTDNEKITAQALLDEEFGAGKVLVS